MHGAALSRRRRCREPAGDGLENGQFVEGGFTLPRGKQRVQWLNKDTLLVGRDFGVGTMSQAGYAITVREWKRGETLDNAKEVYRGAVNDNGYGDSPTVVVDGAGSSRGRHRPQPDHVHARDLLAAALRSEEAGAPGQIRCGGPGGRTIAHRAERGLDSGRADQGLCARVAGSSLTGSSGEGSRHT